MVIGLDLFQQYFKGFEDAYILIGGSAVERIITGAGLEFRTTDDLDLILVAEALTPEFIDRFWEFVKEGQYEEVQAESKDRKFFRFRKPTNAAFPKQLELFSRLADVITPKDGMRFTPIPVDEAVASLSAILMDKDYYQFTRDNSLIVNGLHRASTATLICLKAKAYLDLTERKEKGEKIDKKNINKHRNDIVRLIAIVPGDLRQQIPDSIKADLQAYIALMRKEKPEMKEVLKAAGIPKITHEEVLTIIKDIFELHQLATV